jgi:MYXO-CTERM domain-containing protein
VVEVPDPGLGLLRLNMGAMNGISAVYPGYDVDVLNETFIPLPGRQRLEVQIGFNALNAQNPPEGKLTIFGYEIEDLLPQLGMGGVTVKLEFQPGDFLMVLQSDGQTMTLNDAMLPDLELPVMRPLVLDVNTINGNVSIRNPETQPPNAPVEIRYYEITSLTGSLNEGGWTSLDELEGDPPGFGYDESGGSNQFVLAESYLLGPPAALVLDNQESQSLGHAYNELAGFRDLTFSYTTPLGAVIPGRVNYINTLPPSQPVPEPGGAALGLGAVGLGVRRRRRRA